MNATTARRSPRPPKLFARQLDLLRLISALDDRLEDRDAQNLLFLCCHDAFADAPPYDFVPSEFGAFSFTAEADRAKLASRGLLADEAVWYVTDEGRQVTDTVSAGVAAFVARHRTLRGDALLADVCRRFPVFGTRSERAATLLARDARALGHLDAARRKPRGSKLSSIGYEGRSLERYLTLLLEHGVTLLCDVRRNPNSRKYGFSKKTLARGCAAVGIRYEHLPELGIASEERQSLHSRADYDALFADYSHSWLPKQHALLEKISGWIDTGQHVALTCYEQQAEHCHRHCITEVLERKYQKGLTADHL